MGMKTPVCDFVRRYADENALRLHMPGHKGSALLGFERLDITEIAGADSLYEASGILRESERNASELFGCETFYSTEGSSQCLRAMLYLAALHAKQNGKQPRIAAARNVHKTFLSAVALLDLDVAWLDGKDASYLSCKLTAADIEAAFSASEKPTAVYVTSPDYLGTLVDIRAIAEVCHRHGALLLVDNAHGAYLKFLSPSLHPMDLGADICCDSAHKTLPVLTGGAYLHIASAALGSQAKNALALFGSTSPSYLILQSLDAANKYLADGYGARLASFVTQMQMLKEKLTNHGYVLLGEEPLKLTVATKAYGYDGGAFAEALLAKNIVCEFSDPDFTVMMLTPEIDGVGLLQLEDAMLSIVRKTPITTVPPQFSRCERVCSVRDAMLAPCETVAACQSVGRVLAAASVGCPPAVPLAVCGERIGEETVKAFAYYGIETVTVMQ